MPLLAATVAPAIVPFCINSHVSEEMPIGALIGRYLADDELKSEGSVCRLGIVEVGSPIWYGGHTTLAQVANAR